MTTLTKGSAVSRRPVKPALRPRWKRLGRGLVLTVLGYVLILGPGMLGLFLTGSRGTYFLTRLGLSPQDAGVLAILLAVLGTLLGYALVMVGQVRCFGHAPRSNGAHKIQLAGVLCYLGAPLCLAAASQFGDGANSYAALSRGPAALLALDFQGIGVLLQVAGALLIVLGVMLFSGFALAVAHCLRENSAVRAATCFFCAVGFLLGGTVGLVLEARRTACAEALVALPLGWLLCLLWHTLLVRSLSRRLARAPDKPGEAPEPAPPTRLDDEHPIPTGPYGYGTW
jgi:hypothetical protein